MLYEVITMSKILEKSLRDGHKEGNVTIGTRQVLNSVKNSKLIVLSQSVNKEMFEKIESDAKKEKVPLVNFHVITSYSIHYTKLYDIGLQRTMEMRSGKTFLTLFL